VRLGFATAIPSLGARNDLGCTIGFGEIRNRPDGAELGFDRPRDIAPPDPAIPVQRLATLSRVDADGLREMKLNRVAIGFEELGAGRIDEGMQRQVTAGG